MNFSDWRSKRVSFECCITKKIIWRNYFSLDNVENLWRGVLQMSQLLKILSLRQHGIVFNNAFDGLLADFSVGHSARIPTAITSQCVCQQVSFKFVARCSFDKIFNIYPSRSATAPQQMRSFQMQNCKISWQTICEFSHQWNVSWQNCTWQSVTWQNVTWQNVTLDKMLPLTKCYLTKCYLTKCNLTICYCDKMLLDNMCLTKCYILSLHSLILEI